VFMNIFAELVVAIVGNVVAGIIIALFEEWLDRRNNKRKKK